MASHFTDRQAASLSLSAQASKQAVSGFALQAYGTSVAGALSNGLGLSLPASPEVRSPSICARSTEEIRTDTETRICVQDAVQRLSCNTVAFRQNYAAVALASLVCCALLRPLELIFVVTGAPLLPGSLFHRG